MIDPDERVMLKDEVKLSVRILSATFQTRQCG